MGWKDKLRDPSFRGVPFLIDNSEFDGGRRTVLHEYPQRDKPYSEDMGRKARSFTVDGYVIGDDYMDQRDDLIEALEEEGLGELIHPYLGAVEVTVKSFKISESSSEGRMARFSIVFEEAGEKFFPNRETDKAAAVSTAADEVSSRAAEDFADSFSVEGTSEYVTTDVISLFNAFASAIGDAQSFISDITSLVRKPLNLAAQVQNLISSVGNIRTLLSIGNFGSRSTSSSSSAQEKLKAANNDAATSLIRQTAVAEAAKAATEETYETRSDAINERDEIAAIIDDEAEITPSVNTYTALIDLRAALVQAVPLEDLPELVSYPVSSTKSALVLAYEIYGDAARGDEIVRRNKVRHPGFVGIGEIEVVAS